MFNYPSVCIKYLTLCGYGCLNYFITRCKYLVLCSCIINIETDQKKWNVTV